VERQPPSADAHLREAIVPISSVSGAVVRWPRWRRSRPENLILTAADLRTFEGLTQVELAIGDHGLRIAEEETAGALAADGPARKLLGPGTG